ncbi:Peptidase_S24 domain-containing protein, partial [Cephalotus follicularis]
KCQNHKPKQSLGFTYASPFKKTEAKTEIRTETETEMGLNINPIKSTKIRQSLEQLVLLGIIVTTALMIWQGLIYVTGCESPVVVVLSGSMEPGFQRGDILFLHMSKHPIRAGEIIVFNVEGGDIPIVHRVIEVHELQDTRVADVLTKGDNNDVDDRILYAHGQDWLQQSHIMGRAVGFLPYVGWVTILMTEKPIIKYVLVSLLGLLIITSKD